MQIPSEISKNTVFTAAYRPNIKNNAFFYADQEECPLSLFSG